jgi:hypothetical protein
MGAMPLFTSTISNISSQQYLDLCGELINCWAKLYFEM